MLSPHTALFVEEIRVLLNLLAVLLKETVHELEHNLKTNDK